MKTLIACFCLLSLFSACSSILDTSGNPLVPGAEYYINAPGDSIVPENEGTCQTSVILQPSDFPDTTFKFVPVNPTSPVIDEDSVFNIQFANPSLGCPVWKVEEGDRYVTTGGALGENDASMFLFVKSGDGSSYLIDSCGGEVGLLTCYHIGIADDDRIRRLALDDRNPLRVSFTKSDGVMNRNKKAVVDA